MDEVKEETIAYTSVCKANKGYVNYSTPEVIFNELRSNLETPISRYEFKDYKEDPFVKPFLDVDLIHTDRFDISTKFNYTDEKFIENTIEQLKNIFGGDSNVVYTTHHRDYMTGKTGKTKKHKRSFHFIVANKKIKILTLKKVIIKNMGKFTNILDKPLLKRKVIDTSVYTNGKSIFSLPYTRKTDEKTKNKKLTYSECMVDTLEYFKDCCITYGLNNLPEVYIEMKEDKKVNLNEVLNYDTLLPKVFMEVYSNVEGKLKVSFEKYNKILEIHNVDASKINKCAYYWNIPVDVECPFNDTHESNNRYLQLDFLENKVYLKCHSEKCKNKSQVKYEDVFPELVQFNYMIAQGLNKDYDLIKKYFDARIVLIGRSGKYLQRLISDNGDISFEQTCDTFKDIPIEYETDEGKIVNTTFIKRLAQDPKRVIYNKIVFNPDPTPNAKLNAGGEYQNFNTFTGYGYEKILPFGTDKDSVYISRQKDVEWYLEVKKDLMCSGSEKELRFWLAIRHARLKYPKNKTGVVIIHYGDQGGGKSQSVDFELKIIGKSNGVAGISARNIMEKHETITVNKLFVGLEEIGDTSDDILTALKSRATDYGRAVNPKNEPQKTVNDYVQYTANTNELKYFKINNSNRRFFILNFKKITDKKYLKTIKEIDRLENDPEFIYTFGRFLMELNTHPIYAPTFNVRSQHECERNMPITNAFKLACKEDTIETFLKRILCLNKDYECEKYFKLKKKKPAEVITLLPPPGESFDDVILDYGDITKDQRNFLFKYDVCIKMFGNQALHSLYNVCYGDTKYKIKSDETFYKRVKAKGFISEYNEKYYKLELHKILTLCKLDTNEMKLLSLLNYKKYHFKHAIDPIKKRRFIKHLQRMKGWNLNVDHIENNYDSDDDDNSDVSDSSDDESEDFNGQNFEEESDRMKNIRNTINSY